MGGKPRAKPESALKPPLQRVRVKLDFVVQHRGQGLTVCNWIDVVHAGIQEIGLTEIEYIEGGAKIALSVAPRRRI